MAFLSSCVVMCTNSALSAGKWSVVAFVRWRAGGQHGRFLKVEEAEATSRGRGAVMSPFGCIGPTGWRSGPSAAGRTSRGGSTTSRSAPATVLLRTESRRHGRRAQFVVGGSRRDWCRGRRGDYNDAEFGWAWTRRDPVVLTGSRLLFAATERSSPEPIGLGGARHQEHVRSTCAKVKNGSCLGVGVHW